MDVLSVLLGAVGTLLTLVMGYPAYKFFLQEKVYRLRDIRRACRFLAKRLKKDDFSPDVILVPGEKNALIAHFLKVACDSKPIVVVGSQRYDEKHPADWVRVNGHVEVETSRSYLLFPTDLKFLENKRVLLVDSVQKSGSTAKAISSYLLDEVGVAPENFRFFCIVNSKEYENADVPDYHYSHVRGFVNFPWQRIQNV